MSEVAPRVGAWIEILAFQRKSLQERSLPVWERGLKWVCRKCIFAGMGRSPCGSVD